MNKLLTVALCGLFLVSCNQKKQIVTEPKTEQVMKQVTEQTTTHGIHLQKDSGLVYCYADSQKIAFSDIYLDDGAMAMMLHQQGNYAYVVGDIVPNSNGWTVRYHLYRLDTLTLETKPIGNFAAIHFEDNGFRAATTRQVNPDATCTAEEVFLMRDNFYNYDGTLIRKGEKEYDYDEMIAQYSDSLVNADGYRYDM